MWYVLSSFCARLPPDGLIPRRERQRGDRVYIFFQKEITLENAYFSLHLHACFRLRDPARPVYAPGSYGCLRAVPSGLWLGGAHVSVQLRSALLPHDLRVLPDRGLRTLFGSRRWRGADGFPLGPEPRIGGRCLPGSPGGRRLSEESRGSARSHAADRIRWLIPASPPSLVSASNDLHQRAALLGSGGLPRRDLCAPQSLFAGDASQNLCLPALEAR